MKKKILIGGVFVFCLILSNISLSVNCSKCGTHLKLSFLTKRTSCVDLDSCDQRTFEANAKVFEQKNGSLTKDAAQRFFKERIRNSAPEDGWIVHQHADGYIAGYTTSS